MSEKSHVLSMIIYGHEERGDITRCCDLEDIERHFPAIARAYKEVLGAEEQLRLVIKGTEALQAIREAMGDG